MEQKKKRNDIARWLSLKNKCFGAGCTYPIQSSCGPATFMAFRAMMRHALFFNRLLHVNLRRACTVLLASEFMLVAHLDAPEPRVLCCIIQRCVRLGQQ